MESMNKKENKSKGGMIDKEPKKVFNADLKIAEIRRQFDENKKHRQPFKEVDLFILDNSIRESTVGQLRGHTLENKIAIYNEVKKCGFKHTIVASFSHMTRVDDVFVQYLADQGEDFDNLFAFSEAIHLQKGIGPDGVPSEDLPVSLGKMKQYGLKNPILEIDLFNKKIDWEGNFTVHDMCQFVLRRIDWVLENLSSNAKIFVNIRDLPFAMESAPQRVFAMVEFLATLPSDQRPFGIMFEEPSGKLFPEDVGVCCSSVKELMRFHGWSGKLLVHVHERWGYGNAVQLECIRSGADGIWASVCTEGAAVGHSCSAVTIMNLVRMGNTKVLESYNCNYLRHAAENVTEITTGNQPNPKQIVYGERCLDLTFDLTTMSCDAKLFDLASFFGVKPPTRISTMSSADMIRDRLVTLFGENRNFTLEIGEAMKGEIQKDLLSGRKEEYMTMHGLALLYDRAGGHLDENIADLLEKVKINSIHAEALLKEVRNIWDTWDLQDEVQGDDALQFNTFYNAFMAPYFGCYLCEETRKGLQAIDMDKDNLVEWKEFSVYLKWALTEYPNMKNVNELLSITFNKGIIPAMLDEEIRENIKQ